MCDRNSLTCFISTAIATVACKYGKPFLKKDLSLHVFCLCVCMKIVEEVLKLNEDPRVHGVYLHLPPASLTGRVLNTLKPEKDVDG